MPVMMPGRASARMSAVGRPLTARSMKSLLSSPTPIWSTATPARLANPSAALVGLPCSVEGDILGRAAETLLLIGLPRRETLGDEREAARRGRGAAGDAVGESGVGEGRDEALLEVGESADDHPIGYFFGSDFEEEFAHWATSGLVGAFAPLRSRLCCCIQACATPTAKFLTRWMTPTRSVTLMAPRASRMLNRCEHLST